MLEDSDKQERLLKIIGTMDSQGMSRDQISDVLRQMGLEEDEVDELLKKTHPGVTPSEIRQKAEEIKDILKSAGHLKPAIDKLEEHAEHFDRIHTSLNELHTKQDDATGRMSELYSIKSELDEVKELLLEIKPILAAIQKLDENLLELNKKVLMRQQQQPDYSRKQGEDNFSF